MVSNLWSLAIEPVYIIPRESSVFTFQATVMNPGSGDWWIYGKDANNYYHFLGQTNVKYIKISIQTAKDCKDFNPSNYTTWCK